MRSGAAGKGIATAQEGGLKVGPYDAGRIMDRLTAGALLVDLSSRAILKANEAFCRLSGFEPADLDALDLSRLHDLKDLEWILRSAFHPDQADSVLSSANCVGKEERHWSADVRVTCLTEGGGSLVLLTYNSPEEWSKRPGRRGRSAPAAPAAAPRPARPPAAERAAESEDPLTACTRALAGVRSRDDLGRVLIEASDRLLGCGAVLLLARQASTPGTEIVLSAGLKTGAVDAAHRWLDAVMAEVLLSPERPLVLERRSGAEAPGVRGEDLAAAGVGALAVFPLEDEGRIAGAWVLAYGDPHVAQACDQNLGSAFAAHLAGTLAGVLLLERVRKEKRHQELLNRIISGLRGPFDLDEFLRTLAGELSTALDADRSLILLAPPSDSDPAALPVDFESVRQGLTPARSLGPIPLAGTALGQAVLFSKDPLVIEDLRLRPDLSEDHEDLLQRLDLRGLILVKILSRKGWSGLLAVGTCGKPRRWVPEEVELVRAVADHVSVTLEAARLTKANEDRARQLQLLTEVQQAVGRLRDVGAVLQEAVESLCRSFGYRQARIATLSGDGGGLSLRAWAGEEERIDVGAEGGGERGAETIAEAAVRTGRTQVSEAAAPAPGAGPDPGKVSEIAIPLAAAGATLGVLSVRSDRPEAFADKGRGILETFAAHLVVAIQNARLYEEERRRSRRMEILGALHSDGDPIRSPADTARRAAEAITDAYPEVAVRISGIDDGEASEVASGPRAAPAGAPAGAALSLPIKKGVRELGVLHLRHVSAPEFGEEDRKTFGLLADRLGAALENASLLGQIERERREWERTFDAIPEMLSIHDGYGRLLRANRALQGRLGGDVRPFLGKECGDLLESVVGRPGGCPHAEALEERRPRATEIQGERGFFALTALPCFDAAGRLLYIIHVCREITEEKQIREQLLQNEKMAAVGSLVSGVAHELNNPLAGVTGYAQLLLEKNKDSELGRPLERIRDEAERAARIVKNLLTFARKHKPESVMVSVNEVLQRTLELRAYEMRVSNIKIETDLAKDLPRTLADPNQLQQVFLNVIVNAEQAMTDAHGKGRLRVVTAAADGRIRVTIADDGPGIRPDHLKQIFDPFFTTKEVGRGTGLGLSICHGIIKEHGGAIAAESAEGRGTTFTIDLPVVAGREVAPEGRPAPARQAGPATILVVDDEVSIRELVCDALVTRGHSVDAVESGPEALRALAKRRYDAVVSDLKMPEMTGQELYARIAKDHPALAARVLFTSGDSVSQGTKSFLDKIGRPYLLKPFQVRDLVEEIERMLAAGPPDPARP